MCRVSCKHLFPQFNFHSRTFHINLAGIQYPLLMHPFLTKISDLCPQESLQILLYYLQIHGMSSQLKDQLLSRQRILVVYRPILKGACLYAKECIRSKSENSLPYSNPLVFILVIVSSIYLLNSKGDMPRQAKDLMWHSC